MLAAVCVSATVGAGFIAPGAALAETAASAAEVRAASPAYLPTAASTVAQPDWQARDWAMACMSCHNAAAPVHVGKTSLPALEGRSATAIMTSLQAMRDGRQPATLMPQLLKGYRDDELQRIAAYFAAQPAAKPD
ncbi:Cytochrome subunit of sulfide dehydrogenase [Pandoraea anhela]|uniref:Cytochrome subunit of sulfide dehydrogenase n=2 Tax=Pandoraea anhela TaxID=2508295 RepID=A0A5E4UQT0_9BURK|nr:Cytochrome subunit of sulfide dehydrogenase [Pandoraea anhela]